MNKDIVAWHAAYWFSVPSLFWLVGEPTSVDGKASYPQPASICSTFTEETVYRLAKTETGQGMSEFLFHIWPFPDVLNMRFTNITRSICRDGQEDQHETEMWQRMSEFHMRALGDVIHMRITKITRSPCREGQLHTSRYCCFTSWCLGTMFLFKGLFTKSMEACIWLLYMPASSLQQFL